ncbi:CLUMA_CG001290, isoform A [Clunio marinus]|uniref:CLUMA_CG001290, isoform A n=1 Tax=Clunio marinus TaxID=568069 RepID=A0A1J1HMM3_9DIPT|nr:CLUMA_CG001290, isoform A [Clunio marinus]
MKSWQMVWCRHQMREVFEGSIGHQLVIRPVPLDVSKAADGSAHHVVFKRSNDQELDEKLSDFAYMEPDRLPKRSRRSTNEEDNEERTRMF